jgi:S-DNA-T family DNA segregation ATPase FtsK/SpoIIIE
VITGMIKANVPSRIAFAVSSQTDSRVILDMNGAEALLGEGDMLYKPLGTSKLQRVQGAFISEAETAQIVTACRRQAEPSFEEELLESGPESADSGSLDADDDPVLEDAIRLVAQHQTASVSLIQRRLRVGYTRAGRLIDMLERRGIVSGYEGSKARKVLITETDLPRIVGEAPAPPVEAPEDVTT